MSTTATANLTLTGVCAFNYAGVAVSSASWGVWNDASNTQLGFAGQRASVNVRHAFVYAFTTPTWAGDIDSITMYVRLLEELGSNRTIRWSLTKTNPTSDTTSYTGQDLPTDANRVDDGTIEVTAYTEAIYEIDISLASLDQNTTYYLVLSPYTTSAGASNYATVPKPSSWSEVFAGFVTYEMEASDVSAPDGYFGQAMTIAVTNDGLSKTLTYSCAGQTGTIGTTTGGSISWTPPTSLMNSIPTDTSAECTITCTTAAGTTTCTCTLYMAASVRPYINTSSTSLSRYNSNATVAGWGILLQNFSQLQLVISARGIYSSKIVSWRFVSDAVTMEGTNNAISLSTTALSDIITVAGTFTGTLTVTDERGRSSSVNFSAFTVQAYTPPTATGVEIYRCDSSGNPDSDGTYIYAKATRSYSQVGSNTCLMYLEYKEKTASNYTQVAMTDNTALITGGGNIDVLKTYIARIYVVDSLAGSYVYVSIGTQNVAFNLYPSIDSGAAFGGYAAEEKLVELLNDWALRLPSTEHLIVYASDGVTEQTLQDLLDAISGGGTLDYNALSNKPSINSYTLTGAVTLANIGLVTVLSSSSTDAQFPSAKCVWDMIGDVESALAALIGGS